MYFLLEHERPGLSFFQALSYWILASLECFWLCRVGCAHCALGNVLHVHPLPGACLPAVVVRWNRGWEDMVCGKVPDPRLLGLYHGSDHRSAAPRLCRRYVSGILFRDVCPCFTARQRAGQRARHRKHSSVIVQLCISEGEGKDSTAHQGGSLGLRYCPKLPCWQQRHVESHEIFVLIKFDDKFMSSMT